MASPSSSILKKVLEAGTMAHESIREPRQDGEQGVTLSKLSPFAIVGAPEVEKAGVEHFRLMMDHVPVAMAMLDLQMRYLVANRRWMEDFDLGKRELVGRSHYELFPMLHPGWRHVYDRALKGQVVRCDRDAMIRNGREMIYWWEVRPWRHADTSIGGIMILCSKLEGGQRGDDAEAGVGHTEVTPMHGLESLWNGSLPLLQMDAQGKILRSSVGASMFLLPKGLREGETDFCEVLGEKGTNGPLRTRVVEALQSVLKDGKSQELVSTLSPAGLDWAGEMPCQWLFTKLGEDEALVIGLENGSAVSGPTIGNPLGNGGKSTEQAQVQVQWQKQLLEVTAAEKLSRARETRLRAVLDLAPCGVLVLDEKAKLIFQNSRLFHLLGRGLAEGQRVEDWLKIGSRDQIHAAAIERCWREEVWQRQLVQVMSLVSADDLLKEIEFRPVRLPGGGLMVMLLDVTESRRSEEMLRSVEAKFRTLVQENPNALVLTDRSGAVFDMNPAAEQMLGYTRAELRRMRLSQWMDVPTLSKRAEVLAEMVDGDCHAGDFEGTLMRADDSKLEVNVRVAVVLDSERKALFTVHYLLPRETTTVPQNAWNSEPSLGNPQIRLDQLSNSDVRNGDDFLMIDEAENHEEMRTAVERITIKVTGDLSSQRESLAYSEQDVSNPSVPSGAKLLTTDAHGRVLDWSDEAQHLFGYANNEMVGRGLHVLFKPSDATGFYQELSKQHALAFTGQQVEWTFYHQTLGRQTQAFMLEAMGDSPWSVRLRSMAVEESKPVVVVNSTAEKIPPVLDAEELAHQRLVIGETHQRVRDQLQIISTMLNLQLNTVRNEQAREALRSSQNRISSIAALHQHLARLAGGEAVEFRAFAGGLIARLRECFEIDEEQVALELSISHRPMPDNWMLPLALALNEMVTNAFKHGYRDGRQGVMKVSMEWNDEGGTLLVADDGHGLTADFEDHHHEGMGMKILRVFAGQLGGEVRISSGLYGGVEVQLHFPIKTDQEEI